jgi:L-rhamnose mutarotase
MKRFGQYARLKPGMVEEYERLHAAVWPGVLQTIRECNIRNYSIYRMGDELFACFEYMGTDYEADMVKMASDPVTQSWWTHTHPCFLQEASGVFYQDMKEIFHCE